MNAQMGEGGLKYSCTLPLSSIDGGGWSTPRLAPFTPGKHTQYPLHRRLFGLQDRFERVRKISPPPGFILQTVQAVAISYTD